ncbi:MAG: hypothetical protein PHP00_06550 [Thiotrichaceae bacterium]|nr:hypothetical protein [Thiotrichaceae bacterium]
MTQPWLLRETVVAKEEKLLQLGRNVFGLSNVSALDVIARIEKLYCDLNMPLSLVDEGILDEQAVDKIVATLPASPPLWKIDQAGLLRILENVRGKVS